jgi:hypothetical protein
MRETVLYRRSMAWGPRARRSPHLSGVVNRTYRKFGPVNSSVIAVCVVHRIKRRDKALCAYAEVEAQRWAAELGRPAQPGMFGENLTMRALAVTDSVVGERCRWVERVVNRLSQG